MGFLLGLKLAVKLEAQGTIIEGDCQSITKLLLDKKVKHPPPPRKIASIIQDCRSMINASTTISFAPRSCNNATHHLVSIATKEQIEGLWNSESIDDVLKSIIMS